MSYAWSVIPGFGGQGGGEGYWWAGKMLEHFLRGDTYVNVDLPFNTYFNCDPGIVRATWKKLPASAHEAPPKAETSLPAMLETTIDVEGRVYTETIQYDYDPLYRLTNAIYSSGAAFTYTYDEVGNRLSLETPGGITTYLYDDANRLTHMDGITYTWDANGNLINDGVYTYTFDTANKLISVSDPHTSISYEYNGLGDRYSQTVDGERTDYTLDLAAGLTQVLSDSEKNYLYGNGRIAHQDGDNTEYFIGDALGSVRQLTDENGKITLAKNYKPYGEVFNSTRGSYSPFGYTSEWTDRNLKLIDLRARWYSPRNGHFISKDEWKGDYSKPLSLNGWNYVEANPINRVDPSGHYSISCENNSENSRNLTSWLVRELHAQSNSWPVWPGIGDMIHTSNTFISDATKRLIAQQALDTFRLSDPTLSEEEWNRINQELAIGGGLRIVGYVWWAEMVRDGARWDFKDQIYKELRNSIMLCDNESCDWYGYSMPGNVFYAYVGRVAGFTEFEIRMGAVYAQQIDPENKWWTNTWWGLDQTTDVAAIELGFQMYNNIGRNPSDAALMGAFQKALRTKKADMEHQPDPLIPYITTFPIGPNGPEFSLRYFDGVNFIGIFGR